MNRINCSIPCFVFIAFLCSGCFSISQINRVSSVNVRYSDFKSDHKTIRFVDMNMIGKKRFFENISRLTELSKTDGYVLYYEHFDFSNSSDSVVRKIRRMYSVLPDSQGYSGIANLLSNNGFIVKNDSHYLHKGFGPDITVDPKPSELISAYEVKFGAIRLKKKDFKTPLNQPLRRLPSLRKSDYIFVDYRNKLLASNIQQSPYDKVLVLYGSRHRKGFFRELTNLDNTYINLGRSSTAKDNRFDHTLPPDTVRNIMQNGWIEKMGSHIAIKLSFDNDIESFFVDTEDLDFKIYPNTSAKLKLGINYRFISFSYSYAPEFIPGNDDNVEKGETKSQSFGLNFAFNHWFQGLAYKRTKGYYIKNTNELDPSWQPGDPYFQSPDLVYQTFEGVTGYSFNRKFSVSALTSQTERQLKSAGTITPQLHYRYYIIDDQKELDEASTSQKSNNFEIIATGGYHHTFVIGENWYINGGAEIGCGYMGSQLKIRGAQSGSAKQHNFISRWDARAGVGHNGRRFFAGGFATATGSTFKQENTTAVNVDTRIYFQVFAGYRFTAPNFIRTRFE